MDLLPDQEESWNGSEMLCAFWALKLLNCFSTSQKPSSPSFWGRVGRLRPSAAVKCVLLCAGPAETRPRALYPADSVEHSLLAGGAQVLGTQTQ